MMTKRAKIAGLVMLSVLLVVAICVAPSVFASEVPVLSDVAVAKEYEVNTIFAIPTATLTLGDVTQEASAVLYLPDGSAVNSRQLTLDKLGKYTLEYSANFDGKRYSKSMDFLVYNTLYTIENPSGSTAQYYTKYEFTEYNGTKTPLEGLFLDMASGATFQYNKIIDFSNKTAANEFVRFTIIPTEQGYADVNRLYFKLTDAHDNNNYVIISLRDPVPTTVKYGMKNNAEQMKIYHYTFTRGYILAGSAMQTPSGLEGVRLHVGNIYGYPATCSFHGISGLDYNTGLANSLWAANGSSGLSLDYNTMSIYHNKTGFVVDLDNPAYFTQLWEGFTTGEAYLSVYFSDYTGSNTAKLLIHEIDGEKPTATKLYDDGKPEITVETPETGVYNGVIGLKYPIFSASALDSYDGKLNVQATVYYNYMSTHRLLVENNDGYFTPTRGGNYFIVYTAEDAAGNVATKEVTVKVSDKTEDIKFTITGGDRTGKVGSTFSIANVKVDNALGGYKLVTEVSIGDEKVENDGSKFLPKKVGTYTVKFIATDALGRTAEDSYQVTVEKSDAPVFYSTPILPKYLMSGKTYTLPELVALGYAENNNGTEITAKIYITDKNGRKEVADNTITPVVASSGKTVTIEYVATEGDKSTTYKVSLPCHIVTSGKKLDITGYFATDSGVSTTAKSNMVTFKTSKNNTGFTFINALVTRELDIQLNVDKTASNLENIYIYLEDSENKDISVKIVMKRNGVNADISFNDDTVGFPVAFNFAGVGSDVTMVYNELNNCLEFPNDGKSFKINTTEKGAAFTGFPSGKVYARIVMGGVSGNASVNLVRLNGQQIRTLSDDRIAPKIAVMGEYKSGYDIGTELTLFKAFAGDVLDPNLESFVVSIRDPEGNVLVDNLDLLIPENAQKTLTLKLDSYGSYSLSYTAKDTSGRTGSWSQAIPVIDDKAPVIKLDGKVPTTGKIGQQIQLPAGTVTDNVDTDLKLYVYVSDPFGGYVQVYGTAYVDNVFTPTMAGEYAVHFTAFDSTGNMTYETYIITVE